jgi:hypothetical protein
MKEDHIFVTGFLWVWSRGSSVSIVSDYILDDRRPGFDPWQRQRNFPLASVSRPALGQTDSFPRGKARTGCDAHHSPQSSAEVRNE